MVVAVVLVNVVQIAKHGECGGVEGKRACGGRVGGCGGMVGGGWRKIGA